MKKRSRVKVQEKIGNELAISIVTDENSDM